MTKVRYLTASLLISPLLMAGCDDNTQAPVSKSVSASPSSSASPSVEPTGEVGSELPYKWCNPYEEGSWDSKNVGINAGSIEATSSVNSWGGACIGGPLLQKLPSGTEKVLVIQGTMKVSGGGDHRVQIRGADSKVITLIQRNGQWNFGVGADSKSLNGLMPIESNASEQKFTLVLSRAGGKFYVNDQPEPVEIPSEVLSGDPNRNFEVIAKSGNGTTTLEDFSISYQSPDFTPVVAPRSAEYRFAVNADGSWGLNLA